MNLEECYVCLDKVMVVTKSKLVLLKGNIAQNKKNKKNTHYLLFDIV